MSQEKADCLPGHADCLMKVLRFLEFQMSQTEMSEFGIHLHECADCQDYLDILVAMLPYQDEMLNELSTGDFR